MSLKAALQADLGEKSMNLGDLADKLGNTHQSVSKWIAKDEIPKDRVDEVIAIVGPTSRTAAFIVEQAAQLVSGVRVNYDVGGARFSTIDTSPAPAPNVHRSTYRRQIGGAFREPWAGYLKESLKSNVLRAVEIHGAIRRFDYLSDKLAVEVRPVPVLDPSNLVKSAVPLMLFKARAPAIECKLVLVPREVVNAPPMDVKVDRSADEERAYATRREIVKLDLAALGVGVVELNTAAEVAEFIEAAERGVVSNPPFSYDDWGSF